MTQISSFLSTFSLTWDVGIILFVFFAAFFYGFSVGVRKLGSFLVSIYLGYVLFQLTPYVEKFTSNMPDSRKIIAELAIFCILIFGIFCITAGSIICLSLGLPKKEQSQLWQLLILAVVSAGFFVASTLAFLPEMYYSKLSILTKQVFVLHNAHFWWAVAGIATMAVLRRTKKE